MFNLSFIKWIAIAGILASIMGLGYKWYATGVENATLKHANSLYEAREAALKEQAKKLGVYLSHSAEAQREYEKTWRLFNDKSMQERVEEAEDSKELDSLRASIRRATNDRLRKLEHSTEQFSKNRGPTASAPKAGKDGGATSGGGQPDMRTSFRVRKGR